MLNETILERKGSMTMTHIIKSAFEFYEILEYNMRINLHQRLSKAENSCFLPYQTFVVSNSDSKFWMNH